MKSKENNISEQELKGGSRRRKVCALRIQIAKRGLDELGLSLAEIARNVGVSTSGIARGVKRLEEGTVKWDNDKSISDTTSPSVLDTTSPSVLLSMGVFEKYLPTCHF